MNTRSKIFAAGLLLSAVISGCTKLDEETFGSLSPDTYYTDESTALSSVVGIYQLLSYNVDIGDPWRTKEFSTDEFIVPAAPVVAGTIKAISTLPITWKMLSTAPLQGHGRSFSRK